MSDASALHGVASDASNAGSDSSGRARLAYAAGLRDGSKSRFTFVLILLAVAAFYATSWQLAQVDLARLVTGLPKLGHWLAQAWPPKLDELPLFLQRIAETVAMAAIGTTAATNNSANTNESIPRSAFKNQRAGKYSFGNGVMLRLASTAIGIASKVAAVVPMAAIATVSAIRSRNSGNSSVFGGQACASQWPSFGKPVIRRVKST